MSARARVNASLLLTAGVCLMVWGLLQPPITAFETADLVTWVSHAGDLERDAVAVGEAYSHGATKECKKLAKTWTTKALRLHNDPPTAVSYADQLPLLADTMKHIAEGDDVAIEEKTTEVAESVSGMLDIAVDEIVRRRTGLPVIIGQLSGWLGIGLMLLFAALQGRTCRL